MWVAFRDLRDAGLFVLKGLAYGPTVYQCDCWLNSTDVTQINARGEQEYMDKTDRKILALLQEDAAKPIADIARKVGMSVSPCWRRIQKLEKEGIIKARVALLDGAKLGFGMSVFVAIRTDQHNSDWLAKFAARISAHEEVVEFYRMSGEVDYLLRVVVPDMATYDRFYKELISEVKLTDVSSSFAMEQIKYTTALPLDEVYTPTGKS